MCLHSFYDHTDNVTSVGFHPDGTCVAAGSDDASIKLWDARAGSRQLLQHYPAHSGAVTSISWHPSGKYILSTGNDGSLRIWDLRAGHLLYTLHGHAGAVLSGAWSPKGDWFASGGTDQIALIWKTNFDKAMTGSSSKSGSTGSTHGESKCLSDGVQTSPASPSHGGSKRYGDHARVSPSRPLSQSSASRAPPVPVVESQTSATAHEGIPPPGHSNEELSVNEEMSSKDSRLHATLTHIVKQIDSLARSVSMLDKRLSATEQKVDQFSASRYGSDTIEGEEYEYEVDSGSK